MNNQTILVFIDRSLKNLEKRESQGGIMGGRWVIIMMVEYKQGVTGGSSTSQCGIPEHLEGGRDQQQVHRNHNHSL